MTLRRALARLFRAAAHQLDPDFPVWPEPPRIGVRSMPDDGGWRSVPLQPFLIGARLVRTGEPDEGQRLQEGLIKELTGGEPISVVTRPIGAVALFRRFRRQFLTALLRRLWRDPRKDESGTADHDGRIPPAPQCHRTGAGR